MESWKCTNCSPREAPQFCSPGLTLVIDSNAKRDIDYDGVACRAAIGQAKVTNGQEQYERNASLVLMHNTGFQ
jgi:hypothetical protein